MGQLDVKVNNFEQSLACPEMKFCYEYKGSGKLRHFSRTLVIFISMIIKKQVIIITGTMLKP